MKAMKIFLGLSLIAATTSWAAAQKDNSANATRERAKAAYNELDQGDKKAASPNAYAQTKKNGKSTNSTATAEVYPKPIIMVIPSANGKGINSLQQISNDPLAKAAMDGLNDYLAKKHYEVKSLEGSKELDKIVQMQNDIAGNDEDLAYLAGLALNADIYIKYATSLDSKGFVTIDLHAYETTTARLLGSQTSSINSHGRTAIIDQQANLKTAAKKAMPSIESQILAYWKDDIKLGFQYKVVMNITGDYSDSALEDLQDQITQKLKGNFNKVKVNAMTAKTIDLVVYAPSDKFEDVNEVYRTIRQTLKPMAETKKLNISKKLIVMEVK